MSSPSRTATGHSLTLGEVPALDGLRAIAVLLVMLHHFDWLGCGWIGVQFFFVLSGFLISANLFLSQNSLGPGDLLRSFYVKRFLRIFPLYFLALALYFLFERSSLFLRVFTPAVASGPRGFLAHALFLQNFSDTLFHEEGSIRVLAHFWSLAVEEQFYLVFPFALVLLPRRALKALCWLAIPAAPLLRLGMAGSSAYKGTFGQIDAFAFGILLSMAWTTTPAFPAFCQRYRERIFSAITLYSVLLLGVGLAVLFLYRARGIPIGNTTFGFEPTTQFNSHVWVLTAMDLWGGLLVLLCLLKSQSRILANSVLRYIGRISFGLYVYHYPIAFALEENFHFKFKSPAGAVLFCGYFSATLAVASISYFLWERPFLKLKVFFVESVLRRKAAVALVNPNLGSGA